MSDVEKKIIQTYSDIFTNSIRRQRGGNHVYVNKISSKSQEIIHGDQHDQSILVKITANRDILSSKLALLKSSTL